MGLLSKGLGMSSGKLYELTCLETRAMVGIYYLYCPQLNRTISLTSHTNPGLITFLMQDQWVDVTPVLGALVVNIGNILRHKSVDHWVLANPNQEPHVSVAFICNPSNYENEFRPFSELISSDKLTAFW
ncbi:hypothetical protein EUGRSUZ_B02957 [Eucalyptus grandis]|uniref:Uncharacterized protein n=2 Tax=Eucalyptus grandis TaxID=71139 RepID=A0ACC3LU07_EUCGR|nr:hypothetical protein EUGRSUZ_B02957 [Eucalyptus grandis]